MKFIMPHNYYFAKVASSYFMTKESAENIADYFMGKTEFRGC